MNYVSFVLSAAIINELLSADGIIDIVEGLPSSDVLTTSGFSYGSIPIRISTLTYSEYAASGYDLEDDFDPSVIPMDAADGMYTNWVNCWAINFESGVEASMNFHSLVVFFIH
jgi:hypothetical protein